MKRLVPFLIIAPLLISLLLMAGSHSGTAHAQDAASLTPTYDPLAEPFVPENPSEYELGQNWYWHHCMPCHGDKGQGLTDEFRAIWPDDHQDCWGRGCHAGERLDDSFAIPTIVPSIVGNAKLARFSSLQALCEYLKATHPPQYPGHLSEEQYHAIALYVFTQNEKPLVEITPITQTSTPTLSPRSADPEKGAPSLNLMIFLGLGIILLAVTIWGVRKRLTERAKQLNP